MPSVGPQTMQDLRDEGDLYALAGFNPIAENRYKLSTPLVSRGVSFDPATGRPIAGLVDNVPIQYVNGQPQVIQSDIPQAIAQRAGMVSGAQAAATSLYKTVPLTNGSGATVPTFLTQLPGYPGAQPGTRGVHYDGPPTRLGAPSAPQPQIPAAVLAADRSGSPFVATQAPGQPVRFQQPPTGAGNVNKPDPWETMPRIQIPQGPGQSTYQKGLDERRAATAEKLSDSLGSDASNASNRIATNNQALDVVDKADTGWMANHLADFRNVLAGLGVKSAGDQAATDQVLAKDLVTTALQRGKQLFGARFTQSEVGIMLTRAAPSPEMAKAAIKFLLESDNAVQGYAVQQASDFGRFINSGGDPLQFRGWYAKSFPVTESLSKVQLAPTASAQLPANVVALPNGKVATFPNAAQAAQFRAHIGAR
jgi:hypothetical protein